MALLAVVLISVGVAVYGHGTIQVFERYGAIAFVAFCAVLFVSLLPQVNWGLSARLSGADHLAAWLLGTSVIFALVASWFSFASDYSRYLPGHVSTASVAGWIGAGTGLSMPLFGSTGVLLASIQPQNAGNLLGLITATAPGPIVVPFLLFIAIGEIWANYLDVYTAGLAGLALNLRHPPLDGGTDLRRSRRAARRPGAALLDLQGSVHELPAYHLHLGPFLGRGSAG